ncbi:hypothetical protein HC248_01980 [Polaromonas vacuolata]|uniref:Uncharacterized protein n=1 Tax=Polaromonas vacuolata TaxID=37448 RepID=A0A6H2H9W7_9BURK|nr:hypothetical protein HC248_01980 [Polaromonas vacuolata]
MSMINIENVDVVFFTAAESCAGLVGPRTDTR